MDRELTENYLMKHEKTYNYRTKYKCHWKIKEFLKGEF